MSMEYGIMVELRALRLIFANFIKPFVVQACLITVCESARQGHNQQNSHKWLESYAKN